MSRPTGSLTPLSALRPGASSIVGPDTDTQAMRKPAEQNDAAPRPEAIIGADAVHALTSKGYLLLHESDRSRLVEAVHQRLRKLTGAPGIYDEAVAAVFDALKEGNA